MLDLANGPWVILVLDRNGYAYVVGLESMRSIISCPTRLLFISSNYFFSPDLFAIVREMVGVIVFVADLAFAIVKRFRKNHATLDMRISNLSSKLRDNRYFFGQRGNPPKIAK